MGRFDTDRLVGVVRSLKRTPRALLDLFFMGEIMETSEKVTIDVEIGGREVAPWVAPHIPGAVVQPRGVEARTIAPGYVKPKITWSPDRPLKRVIGEPLPGTLAPDQRLDLLLVQDLAQLSAMIDGREEVMASEFLRSGKVTISGEGFGTRVVDFLRDASQTSTLAGGSQWGDAGVSPYANVQTWIDATLALGGGSITDVVFAPDAYTEMAADTDFEKAIDKRRGGMTQAELGLDNVEGLRLKASFTDNLRFWTYVGTYTDEAGADQKVLPDGWVYGGSRPSLRGVRHYGAIQDEKAGYAALPRFPKSWVSDDPSIRQVMVQSAPLIYGQRPNASFARKVL